MVINSVLVYSDSVYARRVRVDSDFLSEVPPESISDIFVDEVCLDNLIKEYFDEFERYGRFILKKALLDVKCISINSLKEVLDELENTEYLDGELALDIVFAARVKEKTIEEEFVSEDVDRIISMLVFFYKYDEQKFLEYSQEAIDILNHAFRQDNKDELIKAAAATMATMIYRGFNLVVFDKFDWENLKNSGLVIPKDVYDSLSYTTLVRLRGYGDEDAGRVLDLKLESEDIGSVNLKELIILVDYFGEHKPKLQERLDERLSQVELGSLTTDTLLLLYVSDNIPCPHWSKSRSVLESRLTDLKKGSTEWEESVELLVKTLSRICRAKIHIQDNLKRLLLDVLEAPFKFQTKEKLGTKQAILIAKILMGDSKIINMLFRYRFQTYKWLFGLYLENLNRKGDEDFISLFIEDASKEELWFIVNKFLERANWSGVKEESYLPYRVREAIKRRLPDLNFRAPYERMIRRNERIIKTFIESEASYKAVDMGTGGGSFLKNYRTRFPGREIIGYDPFVYRPSTPLETLDEGYVIRDARYTDLPDASIDEVIINHPEAEAVRFSTFYEMVKEAFRILKPGGIIRIVTDSSRNMDKIREDLIKANFTIENKGDYIPLPSDYPRSDYSSRKESMVMLIGIRP